MMTESIFTFPLELNKFHQVQFDGTAIYAAAGPADFPAAARVGLLGPEGKRILKIHFEYVLHNDEQMVHVDGRDGSAMKLGAKSGRVFEITKELGDVPEAGELVLDISGLAKRARIKGTSTARRAVHYSTVARLLQEMPFLGISGQP